MQAGGSCRRTGRAASRAAAARRASRGGRGRGSRAAAPAPAHTACHRRRAPRRQTGGAPAPRAAARSRAGGRSGAAAGRSRSRRRRRRGRRGGGCARGRRRRAGPAPARPHPTPRARAPAGRCCGGRAAGWLQPRRPGRGTRAGSARAAAPRAPAQRPRRGGRAPPSWPSRRATRRGRRRAHRRGGAHRQQPPRHQGRRCSTRRPRQSLLQARCRRSPAARSVAAHQHRQAAASSAGMPAVVLLGSPSHLFQRRQVDGPGHCKLRASLGPLQQQQRKESAGFGGAGGQRWVAAAAPHGQRQQCVEATRRPLPRAPRWCGRGGSGAGGAVGRRGDCMMHFDTLLPLPGAQKPALGAAPRLTKARGRAPPGALSRSLVLLAILFAPALCGPAPRAVDSTSGRSPAHLHTPFLALSGALAGGPVSAPSDHLHDLRCTPEAQFPAPPPRPPCLAAGPPWCSRLPAAQPSSNPSAGAQRAAAEAAAAPALGRRRSGEGRGCGCRRWRRPPPR